MKHKGLKVAGFILIPGLVSLFAGCAVETVRTDLPANHPANPQGVEAVYFPEPNPFQNGVSMEEQKSADAPAVSNQNNQGGYSHGMSEIKDSPHANSTKLPGEPDEAAGHQH